MMPAENLVEPSQIEYHRPVNRLLTSGPVAHSRPSSLTNLRPRTIIPPPLITSPSNNLPSSYAECGPLAFLASQVRNVQGTSRDLHAPLTEPPIGGVTPHLLPPPIMTLARLIKPLTEPCSYTLPHGQLPRWAQALTLAKPTVAKLSRAGGRGEIGALQLSLSRPPPYYPG